MDYIIIAHRDTYTFTHIYLRKFQATSSPHVLFILSVPQYGEACPNTTMIIVVLNAASRPLKDSILTLSTPAAWVKKRKHAYLIGAKVSLYGLN